MQNKYYADRINHNFTIIVTVGGEPLSNGVIGTNRPFESFGNINLKDLKLPTISNEKLDGIIRRQESKYKAMRGSNIRSNEVLTKVLKDGRSSQKVSTQMILTSLGQEVSANTAEHILGPQTWKKVDGIKVSSWEQVPFEKQVASMVFDIIHDRFRICQNVSFTYSDNTGKSFTHKF